ncbi:MAG: winged helix-turn-helix domain-containing protein [Anaerolineae bacterium]
MKNGWCCAVVGLSNTGKSTLLRSYRKPKGSEAPPSEREILIYVDCNRMLDLSEQGFYEAVLRAARSQLRALDLPERLKASLEEAYQRVITPPSPLAVPLGFTEAIERLCEHGDQRIVLLLDEFDEPFAALEGRTFLNLRALRDRYGKQLIYVVAAECTLDEIRDDAEANEFRELFAGHVCRVGLLSDAKAREWVRSLFTEEGAVVDADETGFVLQQAGGHPGLLIATTRLMLRAKSVAPETYAKMGTTLVAEALLGDEIVRTECQRLWDQLVSGEQASLRSLAVGQPINEPAQLRLERLGLIDEEGHLFGAAFASFVRRQRKAQGDLPTGIWLDVDAGDVYIDGRRAPTLTELEYRLLRVLYERKDKLCDKYLLVERVWGEEYIDEVDDARIEKLVSRLRAKIEKDSTNPRYLITVRGRGYRLRARPPDRSR